MPSPTPTRRLVGIIATLMSSFIIARNLYRGQPNGLFPFMLLFIGVIYLLLTWGEAQNKE
jgi:hypothetical protein